LEDIDRIDDHPLSSASLCRPVGLLGRSEVAMDKCRATLGASAIACAIRERIHGELTMGC